MPQAPCVQKAYTIVGEANQFFQNLVKEYNFSKPKEAITSQRLYQMESPSGVTWNAPFNGFNLKSNPGQFIDKVGTTCYQAYPEFESLVNAQQGGANVAIRGLVAGAYVKGFIKDAFGGVRLRCVVTDQDAFEDYIFDTFYESLESDVVGTKIPSWDAKGAQNHPIIVVLKNPANVDQGKARIRGALTGLGLLKEENGQYTRAFESEGDLTNILETIKTDNPKIDNILPNAFLAIGYARTNYATLFQPQESVTDTEETEEIKLPVKPKDLPKIIPNLTDKTEDEVETETPQIKKREAKSYSIEQWLELMGGDWTKYNKDTQEELISYGVAKKVGSTVVPVMYDEDIHGKRITIPYGQPPSKWDPAMVTNVSQLSEDDINLVKGEWRAHSGGNIVENAENPDKIFLTEDAVNNYVNYIEAVIDNDFPKPAEEQQTVGQEDSGKPHKKTGRKITGKKSTKKITGENEVQDDATPTDEGNDFNNQLGDEFD